MAPSSRTILLAFWWAILLHCTMAAAAPRGSGDRPAGLPDSIDPFEFLRLVRERGAIDEAQWLLCEEAFLARQAECDATVEPAIEALLAVADPQSWFNWPSLKPAEVRHRRATIAKTILELDWRLFDGLAERIPALAAPLEHAKRAWTRRVVGLGGRFDLLGPIDLPVALERMRWTADERRVIEPELDRWAEADFARRRAALSVTAAALDDFEQRLGAMGLDATRDAETRETWLPRTFEAWKASSAGLRTILLEAIAAQRATLDRLAELLPPERADELRIVGYEALMASEIAWLAYGTKVDRLDGFGASEELLDLASEQPTASQADREWIAALRAEWRGRSLRVLRAIEREAGKATTPIWPLLGGGWTGDVELHLSLREAVVPLLEELARERDANDARVRDAIIARFGNQFGTHAGAHSSATPGERLDTLVEERRVRRRQAAERAAPERAPERWDPSPHAAPFVPWVRGTTLAYDPGPLDEAEAEAIATFVGADEEVRTWWTNATNELRDAALARIAALGEEGRVPSAWGFTSSGYHFDAGLAARIESAALDQRVYLAEREDAMFDALAAALTASPNAARAIAAARVSLVRSRRSIDRDLAFLVAVRRDGPDQRDRSNPCRAIWPALEADDAVEHLAPLLAEVAAVLSRRMVVAATTLPAVHALDDRLQWERGVDRGALERERKRAHDRFREDDAPHRAEIVSAIDRLIDAACERSPANAATIRNRWNATGLAALFASVPPAQTVLGKAIESQDQSLRERAHAVNARYESRDRPLVEQMVREALSQRDREELQPDEAARHRREQRRISDARELVSDLAIVALRLQAAGGR